MAALALVHLFLIAHAFGRSIPVLFMLSTTAFILAARATGEKPIDRDVWMRSMKALGVGPAGARYWWTAVVFLTGALILNVVFFLMT